MKRPENISIRGYYYPLPEDRIAKYPLAERDASKLLVYKDGKISSDNFRNIAQYIPEGSLLIFNDTKVVNARLYFQKPTGGVIEIFCLGPHAQYVDITTAMQETKKVSWRCIIGGASKWKHGQVLIKNFTYNNTTVTLEAKYLEKTADSFVIEFAWQPAGLSFAEILQAAGATPIPPYIKRKAEPSDKERYQTIYARQDGSVAAPTAGLHFTNRIFNELSKKNITKEYVTLHVGAGTFKPVKTETMQQHEMHAEWIEVHRSLIEKILNSSNKKIIAVGTTSMRTLESLYWLGVKCLLYNEPSNAVPENLLYLSQWEAYDLENKEVTVPQALEALLNNMKLKKQELLLAKTQLLIAPGYRFRIVDGLVTNFHQPESTLLLLVAAFIGNEMEEEKKGWRKVYNYALEHDYRFLSYGDGSLLWKAEN